MLTQNVRSQFLQYFKQQQQHVVVPSSSVLPHDDPTLLFNNAGMNQFKDVFLGKSQRDYARAASSQKCIRVGGKHNDLENVGHTDRHLTFFEMLGNFSFGDYFKEQAIKFAWDVSVNIFGFEPERIWPSVFREDDEAFEMWTKYVPAERITRLNEQDNFWEMGNTGPCGPCSELYYDRGIEFGSATCLLDDKTGKRFLEFWNLVFMQYNRQANGIKENLPKPSIDTGAGLERIMALKMNTSSVFETDILRGLIASMEDLSGIPYIIGDSKAPAFRVIADHWRCLAFAIADGALPSNVDRGYVLRKVLRRAVRYGRQLGMNEPFLAKLLPPLITSMGEAYPELQKSKTLITEVVSAEEEAFMRTLKRGGNLLNQVMESSRADGVINGADAFKLKDTYGLPIEEILLLAKDYALTVDQDRYGELEAEAKERSRATHKSSSQIANVNLFAEFASTHGPSKFAGYTKNSLETTITGIVVNGTFVKTLSEDVEALILLSQTPFYAEMGGQLGDRGVLENKHSLFAIANSTTPYPGVIAHIGSLKKGFLQLGDVITASIDTSRRQRIANNHTATHLLHYALHQLLGEHIKQAGSLVDADHFRFDFNHHKPLTARQIRQLEDIVNGKIRDNQDVSSYEIKYEEAQKCSDIKQFFGEKYDTQVRVIDIGAYSKELCGGTHTQRTGNIGLFRITKEGSIAAGVRRIEAVTGQSAEQYQQAIEDLLSGLAESLQTPLTQLSEKVLKLQQENQSYALQLKQMRREQMLGSIPELLHKGITINKVKVVIATIDTALDELRPLAELVLEQLKSGIIVLATTISDKVHIIAKVSDDLIKLGISAAELINVAMSVIDGKGGGKAGLAQGCGKNLYNLPQGLQNIQEYLKTHLTHNLNK